jgi:hypothetical protein
MKVSVWGTLALIFVAVFGLFLSSCDKDDEMTREETIEAALAEFVADLQSNPPDSSDISERVKMYLENRPDYFFGSTVTLLNDAGKAIASPYWYRENGGVVYADLMDAAYEIDTQDWLRQPIDQGVAIWTDPYFDEGGGNIWMRTRSVPVFIDGAIKAVATTDMAQE